jgi:hypothetical protein
VKNAHSIVAGGGVEWTAFSEAAKQRINEGQRGHKQQAEQKSADDNHENYADPAADPL